MEQIDWDAEQPEHYASNLRLLRESGVRFAHWALRLEKKPESIAAPFVFDLVKSLRAGFQSPPWPQIGALKNTITHVIPQRTLPWMFRWYWLLDAESGIELQELDPFEPLLLCFERGGRPFCHNGYLHIEHSISFPYAYEQWPTKFMTQTPVPVFEIDLFKIDEEFRRRQEEASKEFREKFPEGFPGH